MSPDGWAMYAGLESKWKWTNMWTKPFPGAIILKLKTSFLLASGQHVAQNGWTPPNWRWLDIQFGFQSLFQLDFTWIIADSTQPHPPRNKGLIRPYQGNMWVKNPSYESIWRHYFWEGIRSTTELHLGKKSYKLDPSSWNATLLFTTLLR